MALKIEREGTGWKVLIRPTINSWTADRNAPLETLTCDKLIFATGITSQPVVPPFNLSSFDGFSFHSVEMGRRHTELTADSVNHVTIVGGHKSALEAVGTCAQAGKKVEWLIRVDGGGPTWMMPSKNPDGSSLAKMSTIRALTMLSSSIYQHGGWLNRFLHSGRWWLGTWLMTLFWSYMTKMMQGDKYSKSENGRRLKPQPDRYVPSGFFYRFTPLRCLHLPF
jgi:dimethylaniline monooxygenase (N-oxide forming)